MAHTLKKFISCRGSALFMVVSTMTALTICCMAMYFSVVSSRSTQYAIFNQRQAYESASSIAEAVLAGVNTNHPSFAGLYNEMSAMEVGDVISTGANGFEAFGAATGIESTDQYDSQMGAYMVEITRLPDNETNNKKVFDMAYTVSVNGVKDVYHAIVEVSTTPKETPPAPTQIFAATGYVPNDVFLDGGSIFTDLFFDNEKTIVNAYGGKNMLVYGDLATGGSLQVFGYLIPKSPDPCIFAIRGDYSAEFNQPVTFAAGVDKSTVIIGGNAYFNNNNGFGNANVYINGDLYIKGNPDLSSSNYFVNGNIYVQGGYWVNLDKVRCNGIVDASNNTNQWGGSGGINGSKWKDGAVGDRWDDGVKASGFLTTTEAISLLNEKTATNTFYKWEINDNNPSADGYVRELDEGRSTAVKKKLHFSMNSDNPIPTQVLKYSDAEKGCIIEDVTLDRGNNSFNSITVLIDTGDNPDNVYTIRVKANRDFTGPDGHPDGVNETFSWYPLQSNDASVVLSVLVKGKGSVVIDIPEGVTYQDMSFAKTMHYGWFVLGGGTEDHKFGTTDEMTIFDARPVDHSNADQDFASFVHRDCYDGDGCNYQETSSTNKCSLCEGPMKTIHCSVHGDISSFCPNCQPELSGNHTGACKNHVGIKEIDSYLASHPSQKARMTVDGEVVYPNVNIFLVSCDESADIRLSIMANGEGIIQNGFFGFIYAPYMTFKAAYANQGGTMVRLMGGLTVSDYIIDDSMSLVACWPDKMPTDLMSSDCLKNQLPPLKDKSWKLQLVG